MSDEYNKKQLDDGVLTAAHITVLTREFQRAHQSHGLVPDGKCGPKTRAVIEQNFTNAAPGQFSLFYPLRTLPDGRKPVITSAFRPADRPNHVGVDLFYPWKPGDKPDFTGDKGAAGKKPDGTPRWVVPFGETARAAGSGRVMIAGEISTGFRTWVDHGNGLRTGSFHMLNLAVKVGDIVIPGAVLGEVGDNPVDHDGRHCHFEVSPVDRYEPMDPEKFLKLYLYSE